MRHFIFLLLCCFIFALPAQAQDKPFSTLEHDGVTRTYTLHAPANVDESVKHPLLIVLHPASSSGKAMEAITGFDADADANGYFVVYPDSQGYAWDDYRSLDTEGLPQIDDVGFLQSLITTLADEYPIDSEQVHLVGIANGGAFALRAACDASETFASFIIVSAQMWDYQAEHCPEEVGVVRPMLFVHGMADVMYEIGGHYFPDTPQSITSLNETLDFWRARYGCAAAKGVNSKTILYEYGDCRGGGMYLYAVPQAGGAWYQGARDLINPGGPDYTRLISAFIRGADWRSEVITPELTTPQRTYTLYVPPSYTGESAVPLVTLLHGRSGTGSGMAQISQMNPIADRDNFIALYPDGLQNQWNYGRGWPFYDVAGEVNDEVFLTRLIRSLSSELNLDEARRYVGGFSNGGFMTQRLACTMHDDFAAYASVGATAPYGLVQGCADVNDAIPIMFIHGSADPSVPWMGTPIRNGDQVIYSTATMDNTLGFWVTRNGCSAEPDVETLPKTDQKDLTETLYFKFKDCPADGPVELYAVKEGGHRWHGTDAILDDAGLGRSSPDFNASEVIWAFFQKYPVKDKK